MKVQVVRNLGRTHRILYLFVGIVLVVYAWATHDLIAHLATAALIVLGALLILAAAKGH
jgi:hypothetical protein